MDELKLKVFYNEFYDAYNSECYYIYIKDSGMFLSIPGSDTFRVVSKPTFEVTPENVDSYAAARGFEPVLSATKDHTVTWYEGYESPFRRLEVKDQLKTIQNQISQSMRYSIAEVGLVHIVYVALGTVISRI